jgi:hypothetical protein
MIKAFTVSILSLFSSSVQIAFNNENTEGYLEKAGLLKLTRDICIKKETVPGNTGRMGTLPGGRVGSPAEGFLYYSLPVSGNIRTRCPRA